MLNRLSLRSQRFVPCFLLELWWQRGSRAAFDMMRVCKAYAYCVVLVFFLGQYAGWDLLVIPRWKKGLTLDFTSTPRPGRNYRRYFAFLWRAQTGRPGASGIQIVVLSSLRPPRA